MFVFVRQGRRSLLRITPFALTAAIPGQRDGLDEIPREAVEAIGPTTGRLGNGTTAPVTQITFNNQSVMFGPTNSKKTAWLTVEQADLQAGLQAWKDGDPTIPASWTVSNRSCGAKNPPTADPRRWTRQWHRGTSVLCRRSRTARNCRMPWLANHLITSSAARPLAVVQGLRLRWLMLRLCRRLTNSAAGQEDEPHCGTDLIPSAHRDD